MGSPLSLAPHDEPLLLYTTPSEQDKYASFADLYAIIKTTEKLEKAYVRDAVPSDAYERACTDLIAKFKTLRSALRDDGVPDVEHFMSIYRMDCASAAQRLLKSGLPATIEHGAKRHGGGGEAAVVAEATQHFITAMDVLKLGLHEVAPPLSDLHASLHRVPQLPPDFEGKAVVRQWVATLGRLRAADRLDDATARQLAFDLDTAYQSFHRALGGGAGPPAGGKT